MYITLIKCRRGEPHVEVDRRWAGSEEQAEAARNDLMAEHGMAYAVEARGAEVWRISQRSL